MMSVLSAPASMNSPPKSPSNGRRGPLALLLGWLAFLALLLTLPALAHAEVSVSIDAGQPGFPLKLFVSVTEKDGTGEFVAVPNLDKEDFDIRVGDSSRLTPKSVFSRADDPDQRLSVVFVMDFTGTVINTEGVLQQLKDATSAYAASLQPGDYAAVVKFNVSEGVAVIRPFTEVREEDSGAAGDGTLEGDIRSDYFGTGTNAFDALRRALSKFDTTDAQLPSGPKAIIHISDGEDNSSEFNKDQVIALAQGLGIRIFTIGVGRMNDNVEWLENMLDLANRTGGEPFDATRNLDEVDEAFQALSILLESEYVIEVDSGVDDCSTQTLTVQVDDLVGEADFNHIGCETAGGGSGGSGGSSSGSSGGGGSIGLLEILAGLSLLALRRRLRLG